MRPKERAKKSEERIEESGGNVREYWLRSRQPQRTSKGLSMSGLLGRAQRRRRTRGRSFVQSRWSLRESLVRVFFSVRLACSTLPEDWG
jgi:hypothetical protein